MHQERRKVIIQKTVCVRKYSILFIIFTSTLWQFYGDINAKLRRENIFNTTIVNVSLHQDFNDNGVRKLTFATSKNLFLNSTIFPHQNIRKYTWTSPDVKTHNQIEHILMDGSNIRLY